MRRIVSGVVVVVLGAGLLAGAAGASSAKVVRGRGTATPSFVSEIAGVPMRGRPADVARSYLAAHRSLFSIADPTRDLTVLEQVGDLAAPTVRFGQRHQGVPVFGAQYLVHLERRVAGYAVTSTNGHYYSELDVPHVPSLNLSSARDLAVATLRGARIERVEEHGLTVLPRGDGVLTYHFTLWGSSFGGPLKRETFIGAHDGAPVLAYNDLQADGAFVGTGTRSHGATVPINGVQTGSRFQMIDRTKGMFATGGEIVTHDAEGRNYTDVFPDGSNIATSTSPTFAGKHTTSGAVDAHWGAGQVYDYYLGLGRNSLDGQGGDIISIVNAADYDGAPMFNAFWDGKLMTYGNPDATQLHPFPADLDIVGHELTHGVIEHSADLVYLSQPGAMNEAYADYFGNAIDVNNTPPEATSPPSFLAEDLCRVERPANWTCPLRDLNDGRTVDDYFYELVDFDNGGVHDNSTIYSGALWNIRETLGGERADLIVYKTLTEFTTPLDEFNDGRNSVLAAADALGATPEEIAAINAAFDEKGIVPNWDARPATSGSTVLAADVAPLGFFLEMFAPEASGTKYVIGDYADKRNADGEHPLEIYVGDIAGGPLTKVGEDETSGTTSDEAPDISGNKVVWGHVTDQGGGFYDLDVHSRTIGGSVKTVAGGAGLQMNPAIDGKTIVWEDTRSGNEDIWMKRGKSKPVRVVGGRAPQFAPQVSGDWIAWWVPGIPNQLAPSIGVKNVRTGVKFSIKTTNPNTFIGAPLLGPDYVAWYED
ncbi:MAG TPA: M4 family metallopeptidase, partial [Actinomycetota bacterium]|nr:M4 family metallopeptidase [Actinomycetota bacterium]